MGLHAMGLAKALIPTRALMKMTQVRFDDAEVVFGPIPETGETGAAVIGLFDFSAAINAGNDAEIADLNGISQEIIERHFLIIQAQPVGDGVFVFAAQGPDMTSQDHGNTPFVDSWPGKRIILRPL